MSLSIIDILQHSKYTQRSSRLIRPMDVRIFTKQWCAWLTESSGVSIISLIMHYKLIIHKIETVWPCFIGIFYHFLICWIKRKMNQIRIKRFEVLKKIKSRGMNLSIHDHFKSSVIPRVMHRNLWFIRLDGSSELEGWILLTIWSANY